eukprot:COSAG05_NODE_2144_length_3483_cov_4.181147_4_plen_146_part_00
MVGVEYRSTAVVLCIPARSSSYAMTRPHHPYPASMPLAYTRTEAPPRPRRLSSRSVFTKAAAVASTRITLLERMETIEQEKKYQMSLSEKEVELIGDILHWHADYNDYNTWGCPTTPLFTTTEGQVDDVLLHKDEDESGDEDEDE